MIRIRHQILGGHTHLAVRSGPRSASGHLALAGTLILDNDDAAALIEALTAGAHDLDHDIEILEGL